MRTLWRANQCCTIGGELLLANSLAKSWFFLFELNDLDARLSFTTCGGGNLARSVSWPVFTSEHPESKHDASIVQQSAQTNIRNFMLFPQRKWRLECRVSPTNPGRLHAQATCSDPLGDAITRGHPQ